MAPVPEPAATQVPPSDRAEAALPKTASPVPASPEPASPVPASPVPASPEPASPEPASPVSASPELARSPEAAPPVSGVPPSLFPDVPGISADEPAPQPWADLGGLFDSESGTPDEPAPTLEPRHDLTVAEALADADGAGFDPDETIRIPAEQEGGEPLASEPILPDSDGDGDGDVVADVDTAAVTNIPEPGEAPDREPDVVLDATVQLSKSDMAALVGAANANANSNPDTTIDATVPGDGTPPSPNEGSPPLPPPSLAEAAPPSLADLRHQ